MARQLKAILPPEFKDKAVLSVLEAELRKYAPFFISDFEKTVRPWKRSKPSFRPVVKITSNYYAIQIRMSGDKDAIRIWKFLDTGTRRHVIRVRRAKYLRFRRGGRAGSSANNLFVIASQAATGAFVQKKQVMHPGFPARNFAQLIAEKHQKPFERWMIAAMQKAARASGHGG